MASKKDTGMAAFMASLGKNNAVFQRLQARETGRNPPKSLSGSVTLPMPKVTTGSWSPSPAVPPVKSKVLMSSTMQPELNKVVSRPLEANRSARMTMGSAANRRLQNVRSNRGK